MASIIMLVMSVLTYRRARNSGRSRVFWIAMVWVLGITAMFAFIAIGIVIDLIRSGWDEDAATMTLPPWFGIVGTLIGGWLAMWGADRPLPSIPEPDAENSSV